MLDFYTYCKIKFSVKTHRVQTRNITTVYTLHPYTSGQCLNIKAKVFFVPPKNLFVHLYCTLAWHLNGFLVWHSSKYPNYIFTFCKKKLLAYVIKGHCSKIFDHLFDFAKIFAKFALRRSPWLFVDNNFELCLRISFPERDMRCVWVVCEMCVRSLWDVCE